MNQQEFETNLKAHHFNDAISVSKPAGYVMHEHSHPFEAWALIVAGDITLRVADASTTYAVGDVFRLPAQTPHHESAVPYGVTYLAGRKYPSVT